MSSARRMPPASNGIALSAISAAGVPQPGRVEDIAVLREGDCSANVESSQIHVVSLQRNDGA